MMSAKQVVDAALAVFREDCRRQPTAREEARHLRRIASRCQQLAVEADRRHDAEVAQAVEGGART